MMYERLFCTEHKISASSKTTAYGGQAVIEGVMMRGARHVALSVRAPDGNIVSFVKRVRRITERRRLLRLPVIRGAFALWDSLSLGIEMLVRSAEIASPEEVRPTRGTTVLSVVVAGLFAIGLFILVPTLVTPWLLDFVGLSGQLYVSFFEALLRMLILFGYVLAVSKMEEIQRVLAYHGAEHKVVWAWEKNYIEGKKILETIDGNEFNPKNDLAEEILGNPKDLKNDCRTQHELDESKGARLKDSDYKKVTDNVRKMAKFLSQKASEESKLHPRCGTSFLFVAVLCTWVVFLFISPEAIMTKISLRLLVLPLVAGLAYELLKASAGRKGIVWKLIRAPGIQLQMLTTREPDAGQLEVAATSLAFLLIEERGEKNGKHAR